MNTIIIFSLVILGAFLFIFSAVAFFMQRKKGKGFLMRGMHLQLFLVTLPQQINAKEKNPTTSLQEGLKTAEQFYASLSGIKERSFLKKILFGNPYFVFEIAVHRLGEEIYFYLACPRHLSQLIEKQILSFWPKARIQNVEDYNIFNPNGHSAGSVAQLTKPPIFPLKTVEDFSADPISSITNVLTKLAKEGEGAAIQILIRPSPKSLKKVAEKAIAFIQSQGYKPEKAFQAVQVKTGMLGVVSAVADEIGKMIVPEPSQDKDKKDKIQDFNKPEPTPLSQAQITAIAKKASSPIFQTNIRILASSASSVRTFSILNQIESAFEQFNSPLLNQIRLRTQKRGKLKKLFYNFSFRIFNEKEILTLSSAELACLFHFPSSELFTPHLKWLKAPEAPAPTNLPREGIVLGKNVFRGEEKKVSITKEDRRRHFYIIGQTGTGKSALLAEMIGQDIENGEGVALIDPHGDLAEKVLGLVPKNRIEDVIYFNPGDLERPLGLNMLEYDPRFPEAKTFVVNELLEIFEKLYNLKAMGFGGPVFEQYMRNALLLVMEDPQSGNTLVEVPKVLADANFRKYKLARCQNIVVKNFWEMEAEKAGGEAALANMVPYITSKMNIFIANDLVRPIISQQKSSFNFREIMDEGKILIVNLSKGKLGDINSYLLGMIIVGKILIAAFSRADIPEQNRRDFYLYIDEFHNVTTKTITQVLAEARKYRLSMTFAHQFIGQLDEETRKAIFGNVGSMLVFRVGPEDAKYLLTEFEPVFDENDLVNLDNYNGALRLLIAGETSKPFNIITFPPTKSNPEIAQLVKQYSRLKYGQDRFLVETELNERLKKIY